MFPWLTGVIVVAVLAGTCWIWTRADRGEQSSRPVTHFVIITADSQSTVEWWVRSYVFWHWLYGYPVRFTCVDLGSTDDTLAILTRLKRRFPRVVVQQRKGEDRDRPTDDLVPEAVSHERQHIIDLRQQRDKLAHDFIHATDKAR